MSLPFSSLYGKGNVTGWIAIYILSCRDVNDELAMNAVVCDARNGVLTLNTVLWYARSGSVPVRALAPGAVSGW